MISNCDASRRPLDHPADLYDYHVNILSLGPKKIINLTCVQFGFQFLH